MLVRYFALIPPVDGPKAL